MSTTIQRLIEVFRSAARSTRNSLHNAYLIVRAHRTSFLALQIGYHSLIIGFMGLAAVYPTLQTDAWNHTDKEFDKSSFGRLVKAAYGEKQLDGSKAEGNWALAAALTFPINLVIGSFAVLTLPSMVVPLSGLVVAGYRAALWGLLFSPYHGFAAGTVTIPHLFTMLVEGQAYVLASLGCWIHGRPVLQRLWESVNGGKREEDEGKKARRSWWPNYRAGLRNTVQLYSLITAILAVAAVWEGYEVIHLAAKKR